MSEQFLHFPEVKAIDVEAQIRELLAQRRKHNTSGQGGEDVEDIRAALLKGAAA